MDDRSTCSFERMNFVWVRRSHWSKGYDTHDINKQITISKPSSHSGMTHLNIFILLYLYLSSVFAIITLDKEHEN